MYPEWNSMPSSPKMKFSRLSSRRIPSIRARGIPWASTSPFLNREPMTPWAAPRRMGSSRLTISSGAYCPSACRITWVVFPSPREALSPVFWAAP